MKRFVPLSGSEKELDLPPTKCSRPGISAEMLCSASIADIDSDQARSACGLSAPGLLIPYRHLDGSPVMDCGKPFARLRLSTPVGSKKYHQAAGSGVHVFLPPKLDACPPDGDLVVVEGEFKALSLMDAGISAVGISGFFGYAQAGGEKLIPELVAAIQYLRPSRILFVGDTDTTLNHQFPVAAVRLAQLIGTMAVILPRLPLDGPGKGVDDCREALKDGFPDWWRARVEESVPIRPRTRPGSLSVQLLQRERLAIARLQDEEREKAIDRVTSIAAALENEPIEQEKVYAFATEVLNLKRAPFKKAARKRRDEQKRAAADALRDNDRDIASVPLVDFSLPHQVWTGQVLKIIGPDTFVYGEVLCAVDGDRLVPFSPAALCSFVDNPKRMIFVKTDRKGNQHVERVGEGDMRVLLNAWREHQDLVRVVDLKSRRAVLLREGDTARLVSGYCPQSRILAGGMPPELPTVEEAKRRLAELLRDYDFLRLCDRARAMAAIVSPALVKGGFLGAGRNPFFFVEKNDAGAGASLLARVVANVYGLPPRPISNTDDPTKLREELSERLLAGDEILYIDNVRGKVLQKCPAIESMATEPSFTCRVPYRMAVVDVTRRTLLLTTNGAVLSGDLATRVVKISIRKRARGYTWHPWAEGSLEAHVAAQGDYYLAAIYALTVDWIKNGSPGPTKLTGFRFIEWERVCGGLIEFHFGLDLFDDEHEEEQKLLANPDHDLLRNLFQRVVRGETRADLTASALAELAIKTGMLAETENQARLTIGKILTRSFPKDGDYKFDFGRYLVRRGTQVSEGGREFHSYTIQEISE